MCVGWDGAEELLYLEVAKLTNDEGSCLGGLSFGTDGRSTSATHRHTGLCCAGTNRNALILCGASFSSRLR